MTGELALRPALVTLGSPGPASSVELVGLEPGRVLQVREGAFHIWNADPTTWADRACEVVGRNLTLHEWEQFVPGDRPYRSTCA